MAHYDCHHCGAGIWENHGDNCPDNPLNVKQTIVKPPIGLRPKEIVAADRLQEIHEAIGRYLFIGKKVPQEWIDEFSELNRERK